MMMGFLRKEPAIAAAVLSLLGAILGLVVKNPALVASLLGVAGVFVGVRQVVVPVVKVVETATVAATTAATEVVRSLNETVVGVTGVVLPTAARIIDSVVETTIGKVLGGLAPEPTSPVPSGSPPT